MTVSIIICTRNRANSLRPTLFSIGEASVPAAWSVELIIVDNGSTDHTNEVVREAQLNNMAVRYVTEPKPGQARARNTGLGQAQSGIILFTDDDIRVSQSWIEGMCSPILSGAADAVQGGVRPAPHLERPWLRGSRRVWIAAVEDPIQPPLGLVGANMAFRRDTLQIVGGFDPRLGPGAAGYYDDTMFGWRLKQAGQKVLYCPTVSVEHHFDPSRLTLTSFVRTAKHMAYSRAIVAPLLDSPASLDPSIVNLLGELPFFGVQCVKQVIQYMKDRSPHAGFLSRYYNVCLWIALWKASRVPKTVPYPNSLISSSANKS